MGRAERYVPFEASILCANPLKASSEDELNSILSSHDGSETYFTTHTLAGDTVQLCPGGDEKTVT